MPNPHPRLVLMTALGHDPLGGITLSITPAHLAETPDVLPMLVRSHPQTIQRLFQRDDLPADQRQQLGEAMLTPHETVYDLPDMYHDELVLLALAALRDGRLLPTPAIRRHVTTLMAADEDAVTSGGPMAALLCAEALGWPLPKHTRRIRTRWRADRDWERRMAHRNIREVLPAGVRTLPMLSFETPWECAHLTARVPAVIGTAPSLTLEEAEARIVEHPDLVPHWRDYIRLVAPPNAPDFWQDLPTRGSLPPRYESIAEHLSDRLPLAPVSVDICDRLQQAVEGARRLKDAEPYLRLIRSILVEQPETGLPLYHVLLQAAGRWNSAVLTSRVVANCPLTPATHGLWWELVAALFPDGGRPSALDWKIIQHTLLAHRVTFPEQHELRRPPAAILEKLWAQDDPDIRLLLVDHGVRAPAAVGSVTSADETLDRPLRLRRRGR